MRTLRAQLLYSIAYDFMVEVVVRLDRQDLIYYYIIELYHTFHTRHVKTSNICKDKALRLASTSWVITAYQDGMLFYMSIRSLSGLED